MKTYQKLDVEYNKVVILDFLSSEERKKHQITSDLVSLIKNNHVEAVQIYLSKKEDIEILFMTLINDAKSGQRFMLHIVAHGNKNGIGFKHTNELILWCEFEALLIELNNAVEYTLIVNFNSCFGLHGMKTVNPFCSTKPFFGLIGYANELEITLSKTANNFFYMAIFKGFPINESLKIVQRLTNDYNFHCFTSQGYSHLKRKE